MSSSNEDRTENNSTTEDSHIHQNDIENEQNQQTNSNYNNDYPHSNVQSYKMNSSSSSSNNKSSTKSNSRSKDFRGGQDAWQSMFYNLMVYKVNHDNDTNVKFTKERTPEHSLYLWLQNQRKHYKLYIDGKPSFLNEERIKILQSVGVEWSVRGDVFWLNMYDKLKEYKAVHGDTIVPRRWEQNTRLGEWVTDQRRQYKYKVDRKSTLLTDEREKKLNEIGFIWSLRGRTDWQDRFDELLKFRHENGHCIVPQFYSQNKCLGKWVSKQREQYKLYLNGKASHMTQERIDKLNNIGFVWVAKGRRNIESLADTALSQDNNSAISATKTAAAAVNALMTDTNPTNSIINTVSNPVSIEHIANKDLEETSLLQLQVPENEVNKDVYYDM